MDDATQTPLADNGTNAPSASPSHVVPEPTSQPPPPPTTSTAANDLDKILREIEQQFGKDGTSPKVAAVATSGTAINTPNSVTSVEEKVTTPPVSQPSPAMIMAKPPTATPPLTPSTPTIGTPVAPASALKPAPGFIPSKPLSVNQVAPPTIAAPHKPEPLNPETLTTLTPTSPISAQTPNAHFKHAPSSIVADKNPTQVKSSVDTTSAGFGSSNNNGKRSLLQKLGGTKFIAGAIALIIAITGLSTSIFLQQQEQDIRQRASGNCWGHWDCAGDEYCDGAFIYDGDINHSNSRIGTCKQNSTGTGATDPCDGKCTGVSCGANEVCSCGNCVSTGGGDTGGGDTITPDPTEGVDCNSCGGYNQGLCPGNTCGTEADGCDPGLNSCGGGCYNPDQTKQCPGVPGCRNPSIACGEDQCANVVCETGFYCNGGACVAEGSESDYEYITFTCDVCTAEGFCETGKGTNPRFSTGNNPSACAQVDRRPKGSTGDYTVVSLCDESCRGTTSTPPPEPTPTATPTILPIACVGIQKTPASPALNSQVTATCTAVTGATSYRFQYLFVPQGGGSPTTTALAASTIPNVSNPFTVSAPGQYAVQCQACNSAGCSAWNPVSWTGDAVTP